MDIGFIWDEDKYQEVQRKHSVQFYEVVSAFDDPDVQVVPDPQGNEDRWMLVAKTFNGRILSIICSDEDAPLHRLKEDTTGKAFKHRTEKANFEHLTPDQIARMRAKRFLLDEKLETTDPFLTQITVFDQMLLETAIRGELSSQYGNRLQALTSPIPELYQHFKKTPKRFKKFARLISVLYLKLSNTVEDILQLDVELLSSTELKVKFKGRRTQLDVNKEPALLEFEGNCPLPE